MKKLVLAFLAVALLASCNKIMYKESVYVVDYREYIKEGFIISPTVTGFNYQPISNIEVVFSSGASVISKEPEKMVQHGN